MFVNTLNAHGCVTFVPQFVEAWPVTFWYSKNTILFRFWWLMVQLRFSGAMLSGSSKRLSTVKSPFIPGSCCTEEFRAWFQLMLAAGFPFSALHTATIVLSLCSIQAFISGVTKSKQTKKRNNDKNKSFKLAILQVSPHHKMGFAWHDVLYFHFSLFFVFRSNI